VIISHTHKYLFIELPRTGSTAVANELCESYDGRRILKKHATYRQFLKKATEEEKGYFVFSGIRNPLDKIVSLFFKYKTNQRGYDSPELYKNSNVFIAWLTKSQFSYVQRNDADFADFFTRFYHLPYDDWSSLDHTHLDFIIHFERLEEDFAEALKRIGIESVRPLPVHNKTAQRDRDFWTYYTPGIRDRAVWVFGPYLKRWGYSFPAEWNKEVSLASEIAYRGTNAVRHVYWRYLR
jgi:hypothetical protein